MSLDILIHKNSYTKTHTSLIYSLIKTTEKHHVINTHDKIYDLFYLFSPEKIFLQIEEYTNEWHSFIEDVKSTIFITVDNNEGKYKDYLSLLNQIKSSKAIFICPESLSSQIKNELPGIKYIEYSYLYNNDVFYKQDLNKNDKTLCIMSTNSNCLLDLEDTLYPKTKEKLVLVNNIEVDHEQNIGLMFDYDMNIALNSYSLVLDLSKSYTAEIVACETKISPKDKNIYPDKEKITTTDSFVKDKIL